MELSSGTLPGSTLIKSRLISIDFVVAIIMQFLNWHSFSWVSKHSFNWELCFSTHNTTQSNGTLGRKNTLKSIFPISDVVSFYSSCSGRAGRPTTSSGAAQRTAHAVQNSWIIYVQVELYLLCEASPIKQFRFTNKIRNSIYLYIFHVRAPSRAGSCLAGKLFNSHSSMRLTIDFRFWL